MHRSARRHGLNLRSAGTLLPNISFEGNWVKVGSENAVFSPLIAFVFLQIAEAYFLEEDCILLSGQFLPFFIMH